MANLSDLEGFALTVNEDALDDPRRRKNTIHESIKVSLNFIGIFRPRFDLDVQFSELYS